jgi:hypothetical protein
MMLDDNDYERWEMWFGVRVSLDLVLWLLKRKRSWAVR